MTGDDRTTIGLTPENKATIEEIDDNFNEQTDAAKFAMSLAIDQGVKSGTTTNTETVWNVGSFDPDGELRNLVIALYPSVESPYVTVEHFVNQGLQLINQHLSENKDLDILEFI
jgi:hypothetical protein